jgi:steroid 5-alpha reductase family enzyme
MSAPLATLALAFAMMSLLWLLSLVLRDVSIIDISWAPGFAIVAAASACFADAMGARSEIALGLVVLWAIRLGGHIYLRWRRLGHEDYRYAHIRKRRGPNFPLTSLFYIFWLQAFLLWLISWPLQAVFAMPLSPLNFMDAIGIAMMFGGIAIEAIADWQLTRFRADPASTGRVLDSGVWAWLRHPNYFGDFMLWWGIYLIALAAGGPWWTIIGPLAMSALLIHYSGKGLMEDTIGKRRPGYAEYIRRTSGFVPLPPRRQ